MLQNTFSIAVLLLATTAPASASSPDLAIVEKLERTIQLPEGSHPLDEYDRYYAPGTISGRQTIVGLYLATRITDRDKSDADHGNGRPPRKGQLHLLAKAKLLPSGISDGGCEEVHVFWDVVTAKIAGVYCNGLA